MPSRIEDYAFLSDLESGALVGRDGSIDWLTFPRFDSGACFAAILGDRRHGRWLLAPRAEPCRAERHYRDNTLILETTYTTDEGEVVVIDCMSPRDRNLEVTRLVEGRRGRVAMQMELIIRFDYGSIVPWVRRTDGGLVAIGGPDALRLATPVEVKGRDMTSVAEFSVGEGETVPFRLTWHPAHIPFEPSGDPLHTSSRRLNGGGDHGRTGTYHAEWVDEVGSSLRVLKGLTYADRRVGGGGDDVAAGEDRRRAELGLSLLLVARRDVQLARASRRGYHEEAQRWRDWLLRAVAGEPSKPRSCTASPVSGGSPSSSSTGCRGYEGSKPVRIGNAASRQYQLDVYGEVFDALYHSASAELPAHDQAWPLQLALMEFLESGWKQPG